MNLEIRKMSYADIDLICMADNDLSDAFKHYLRNQLENQKKNECDALIAFYNGEAAGHLFLYHHCRWGGCKNQNLPSVVDLKVFPKYRNLGIASKLMDQAEDLARKYADRIYLDVCLNSEYGAAQRLYVKRGYLPDGKGVYYEEEVCAVDGNCLNNDELTLCLIKTLIRAEAK